MADGHFCRGGPPPPPADDYPPYKLVPRCRQVYLDDCRSLRFENKAASKKEKYEKNVENKMSTPIVSLYKDTALPTGHTSY